MLIIKSPTQVNYRTNIRTEEVTEKLADLGLMDGMARLEDGCQQEPGTTCYQYNVLFIVVLQGSAATALSPSDLSIIQPAYKCAASGLPV